MRLHSPIPTSAKTKSCAWIALDVLERQQVCVGGDWGVLYLFVFSGPIFQHPVLHGLTPRHMRLHAHVHACTHMRTHTCMHTHTPAHMRVCPVHNPPSRCAFRLMTMLRWLYSSSSALYAWSSGLQWGGQVGSQSARPFVLLHRLQTGL